MNGLLKRYDKNIIPVLAADKPVNVSVSLFLTNIVDFDVDSHIVTVKVWLAMVSSVHLTRK